MKIDMVPIESVIPYDKNPRKNTRAVKKIAASIKEFGWRQPIVVDKDMVIVAGHTRYLAACMLGYKEVSVHVAANLTEAQVRAYRVADNRTAELAEWDDGKLDAELAALRGIIDMESFGFKEPAEKKPKEGRVVKCPKCGSLKVKLNKGADMAGQNE